MQRRRVQIRLFLLQRLTRRRVRTRKSPLFAGQMHGSPVEFDTWRLAGGRTRARTWDPLIKSQLLYQLSYAPGTGPESLRKRASFSKATPRCPANRRGIPRPSAPLAE